MGKKVNPLNNRVQGLILKGNKHQLSRMLANMKGIYGGNITVGRMFSHLNRFPGDHRQFMPGELY